VRAASLETGCLQAHCGPFPSSAFCLPCRRSRVRIPSAASEKACICRPFSRAQSACASPSGRTDSGLAAGRSSAVPTKTPCLQADSGSSEPKSFCGPAEGRVFCLLVAVSATLAATARSCGQRLPGRLPAVAVLGASPVSVRKPRGQPRPAPRPASHGPQSRELSPQDGVRGSGRVPITGGLCRRSHTGSSPKGVAFHRQAGACVHLGWDAACRPQQEPTESRRACRVHAKAQPPDTAGYDGSERGLRAADTRQRWRLSSTVISCSSTSRSAETRWCVQTSSSPASSYAAAATASRSGPGGPLDLAVSVARESGDPAHTLVRVARERAAALIFTGTRGRNALKGALLGSVSAGVVGVADRPVGLVPASVREAERG
jgi:nucleotide-binding universal stress UspA family protein